MFILENSEKSGDKASPLSFPVGLLYNLPLYMLLRDCTLTLSRRHRIVSQTPA